MPYLHQNRFDPKPLELEDVRGIAVDQNGNVMAQVCVGLFSEPDHQLLRYAQSDNEGAFTVDKGIAGWPVSLGGPIRRILPGQRGC